MIACITVTEPFCLVIEFCQLGDLCHLLRREKEHIVNVRRKTQCFQQIISAERRQFAVYERSVVVFMASRRWNGNYRVFILNSFQYPGLPSEQIMRSSRCGGS